MLNDTCGTAPCFSDNLGVLKSKFKTALGNGYSKVKYAHSVKAQTGKKTSKQPTKNYVIGILRFI